MEGNKFEPKGEDVIRQEVIEAFKGDNEDFDEESNKEVIDKITQQRMKDEEFKASLHKQKSKARQEAENYYKAKEYYKQGGKPKGEKEPKGEETEYLTKQEFEELQKKQQERQRWSMLEDHEYEFFQGLAQKEGKSISQIMEEHPIAKTYVENSTLNQRLAGASVSPGTRISTGKTDKPSKEAIEFARKCGNDPEKVYNS